MTASGADSAPAGLFWNLISAVVPLVGSFLVSLLIAPYLGPRGFGLYMTVMTAATLLLIVGKFGIHAATSRLLSEHEDEAGLWLRVGLGLRLVFTLAVAGLATLARPWLSDLLGGEDLDSAMNLVGAVIVSASLYEMTTESLVGLRRFRTLLVTRLAFLALRLGVIAWVRWGALGVTAFLAGHASSQALPAVVVLGWMLLHYRMPAPSSTTGRDALAQTWRISVPLAVGSASFLAYAHTDRAMLAALASPEAVGQFGVARNIMDAALFPVFALGWSLRPALVRAVAARNEDPDRVQRELGDGFRYSLFFGIAMPVLLAVYGVPLLVHLYGPEYTEASRLLLWMLPVLAIRALGALVFPALLAADAQAHYAKLMGATALVNVLANALLIPRYGAVGAVVATFLSLVPLTAGGFLEISRRLGSIAWRPHASWLGRSLALVAAIGAVGLVTRPDSMLGQLVAATLAGGLIGLIGFGVPRRFRP